MNCSIYFIFVNTDGTIVFQCDFEVDLCTMVNSVNDYYDWVRARGPQLILYTGPSSAISGSYYLLADANEYRFPGYFAVYVTHLKLFIKH